MAGILGLQNQWDMPPKSGNLRTGTLLKTVTPEILAVPQSKNYEEVPVQSVCFYFFHNDVHDFLFSFLFFAPPKREWRVGSHPIHPPSSP